VYGFGYDGFCGVFIENTKAILWEGSEDDPKAKSAYGVVFEASKRVRSNQ